MTNEISKDSPSFRLDSFLDWKVRDFYQEAQKTAPNSDTLWNPRNFLGIYW